MSHPPQPPAMSSMMDGASPALTGTVLKSAVLGMTSSEVFCAQHLLIFGGDDP